MSSPAKKPVNLCAISMFADDLLALILNRVTEPVDRKSFSEVCKQWFRVEAFSRSSIRVLDLGYLRHVLSRYPNLVTFETSKCVFKGHLRFLAQTCPKLEAINLSTTESDWLNICFGVDSLCALSNSCPKLSKVSLRGRRFLGSGIWLKKAHNLTYLDLGHNVVSDEYLKAIGSCSSITYLNLEMCPGLSDKGLGFLGNGSCSKTLKTLVVAQCNGISDFGVSHLRNMRCLEDLNLDGCLRNVSDIGVRTISGIQTLKKLNLSRLHKVSDQSIVALAENCVRLEVLDLSGCKVTGYGIRAFFGHRCLESLVLGSYFHLHWRDVEHLVLGCWSLKSIVLKKDKVNLNAMPESVSGILRLV
ncbi:F-box/LRR-repeat protein 3-like [Rosa sericea]